MIIVIICFYCGLIPLCADVAVMHCVVVSCLYHQYVVHTVFAKDSVIATPSVVISEC